ncbi:hypothetical protein [Streptomyces qaidamensis]|nr:hypothetical protein [Streptomyces qaidamensis]
MKAYVLHGPGRSAGQDVPDPDVQESWAMIDGTQAQYACPPGSWSRAPSR